MHAVLIVGPRKSGKDTVAAILCEYTGRTYGGATSEAIAQKIAQDTGQSVAEVTRTKEADRRYWRDVGDQMREKDPAALARMMWTKGEVITGVRSGEELSEVVHTHMATAIIWIVRPDYHDPTLDFDLEKLSQTIALADRHIPLHLVFNTGDIETLRTRTIRVCDAIPDLKKTDRGE